MGFFAGYNGIVLKKATTTTDTEEQTFNVTETFDSMTVWGWDASVQPIKLDKLIGIQNALHST